MTSDLVLWPSGWVPLLASTRVPLMLAHVLAAPHPAPSLWPAKEVRSTLLTVFLPSVIIFCSLPFGQTIQNWSVFQFIHTISDSFERGRKIDRFPTHQFTPTRDHNRWSWKPGSWFRSQSRQPEPNDLSQHHYFPGLLRTCNWQLEIETKCW